MCEIEPGVALDRYGGANHLDETTGRRGNQPWTARTHVK